MCKKKFSAIFFSFCAKKNFSAIFFTFCARKIFSRPYFYFLCKEKIGNNTTHIFIVVCKGFRNKMNFFNWKYQIYCLHQSKNGQLIRLFILEVKVWWLCKTAWNTKDVVYVYRPQEVWKSPDLKFPPPVHRTSPQNTFKTLFFHRISQHLIITCIWYWHILTNHARSIIHTCDPSIIGDCFSPEAARCGINCNP